MRSRPGTRTATHQGSPIQSCGTNQTTTASTGRLPDNCAENRFIGNGEVDSSILSGSTTFNQ
jgi:hypothetical protein